VIPGAQSEKADSNARSNQESGFGVWSICQSWIFAPEQFGLLTRSAATGTKLATAKSEWHLAKYDEQLWLASFKVPAKPLKGIDA
jgi:hypothetical protein